MDGLAVDSHQIWSSVPRGFVDDVPNLFFLYFHYELPSKPLSPCADARATLAYGVEEATVFPIAGAVGDKGLAISALRSNARLPRQWVDLLLKVLYF